jgi:hypothetical protein
MAFSRHAELRTPKRPALFPAVRPAAPRPGPRLCPRRRGQGNMRDRLAGGQARVRRRHPGEDVAGRSPCAHHIARRQFPDHDLDRCSDDSVERAINTAEMHGHLTWVHRIARVWREEPAPLLGGMRRVRQMNRTSNGYRFFDPLEREPGRNGYKPQNPGRPINQEKKKDGARLVGSRVMQEEPPRPPPEPPDKPVIAPQREHGMAAGVLRPRTELAALVARQDAGLATAADWRAYERAIAAMLLSDRLHQ